MGGARLSLCAEPVMRGEGEKQYVITIHRETSESAAVSVCRREKKNNLYQCWYR